MADELQKLNDSSHTTCVKASHIVRIRLVKNFVKPRYLQHRHMKRGY